VTEEWTTDDRLMTIKQLAGYLNLNERAVLRLVTDGALPGVKDIKSLPNGRRCT
jgi:hypothetical protein